MNDILIRTRNVYTRKDRQETSTLAVFHGYMPGIFQGFSVASAASSCSICLLAWKGLVIYIWLYFYMFTGGLLLLVVDCLIPIKLPYFEGRYDKVSSRDEVCIRSNGSQAANILGFLLKHGKGWKSAAILAIYVLPWAYVNLLEFAEKIVSPSRARRRMRLNREMRLPREGTLVRCDPSGENFVHRKSINWNWTSFQHLLMTDTPTRPKPKTKNKSHVPTPAWRALS